MEPTRARPYLPTVGWTAELETAEPCPVMIVRNKVDRAVAIPLLVARAAASLPRGCVDVVSLRFRVLTI